MARTTARSSADTHDYECPDPGCGFVSAGWETKAMRDARGRSHKIEHEQGEAMLELADFRKFHASKGH
jgi:hypothetical protein